MNEQHDTIQRFMFEHASIRGEMVQLDDTYQSILRQRPYPDSVRHLLGEALVSCLLLAGSIKFEGEISLQFQGDARLPLLLVHCDHKFRLRGFAKYQTSNENIDYHAAFLNGNMALTIHQYQKTDVYQSVVPIIGVSMADNLMHYFAQSEQIASRVSLAVSDTRAAGMLLQLLPGQNTQQREQFWEYAVQIGQTISEQELLTLDNPTILHRLYHETQLRLYPARGVQFHCRCAPEKMKQVLTVLGEKDVQQLLQEQGQVTVTCDFCNRQYAFDAIDVAMLFRK
jgi:molecular chaperone Hsp33